MLIKVFILYKKKVTNYIKFTNKYINKKEKN